MSMKDTHNKKYNKRVKDESSDDEDYEPSTSSETEEEEEQTISKKDQRIKKLKNIFLLLSNNEDDEEEEDDETSSEDEEDIEEEYIEQKEFNTNLKDMVEMYKKYRSKKNPRYLKMIERKLEKEQEKFKEIEDRYNEKQQKKLCKEFKTIFKNKIKTEEDDISYFNSLTNEEQKLCNEQLNFIFNPNDCKQYLTISNNVDDVLEHLTTELNKVSKHKEEQIFEGKIYHRSPILFRILKSHVPYHIKQKMIKDYEVLSNMSDDSSNEYHKREQYLKTLLKIPFGRYKQLPVQFNGSNHNECSEFIKKAYKHLDTVVYGMEHVKTQIMQIIGQWLVNPSSVSSAIALKGPPGTGKTSIIKEGISKVLKRPFAFIPLGGVSDGCFLDGHSYTYDGSRWGKIVDTLTTIDCMNPVFYFDELDKISDTPKGDEINGILTHLTDTTQNSQFSDKYFSDIEFNLSKSLFIFSYNDEHRINPILKDRLYIIETKGYTEKEKIEITKKHLIPHFENIFNNLKLNFDNDDVIQYIIRQYTNSEEGVRELKRCIEKIYSKMNLYYLGQTHILNTKHKITFPLSLKQEHINQLLHNTSSSTNKSYKMMYM